MKRRRTVLILILTVTLLLILAAAALFWRENRRQTEFTAHIRAAARRYDLDPLLVRAVVWRESRFNPGTRGAHGELGLMQLQEVAAQEWADAERVAGFEHEHCADPATNTLAGSFYLAKLMKRYTRTDDPIPYALADYNAGRGNVIRWNSGAASTNSAAFIGQIGFPGTRNYVKAVMRRHALYRFLSRLGLE